MYSALKHITKKSITNNICEREAMPGFGDVFKQE